MKYPRAVLEIFSHTPLITWVILGVILAGLITFRDTFRPLVRAFVDAMAAQIRLNPLLYALAFTLAASATSDSIAETFGTLTPAQWDAMGWWQLLALAVKAFKPAFATTAALLIKPPILSGGASTTGPTQT